MLPSTVRGSALQQLRRVEQDGAYISMVAKGPSSSGSSAGTSLEARRATFLVAGVTRWRRQLDCIIANACGKAPQSLEPAVLDVRPRSDVLPLQPAQFPQTFLPFIFGHAHRCGPYVVDRECEAPNILGFR